MDGSKPLAARERLHVVIAGHVDHGKSTVIGRLLADHGALPDGKLEQVRALCERTARPFEYAFLLDALKDEQAQGITIDAARVFFKTKTRDYLLIDAPGHIEFLRNMVTGASRAEAALLVIDAKEGARENSYRHGYLLAMLGVKQLAVLINKMDLCGYDQATFQRIAAEYTGFLHKIGVSPTCFIPVQGRDGENIARRSPVMPWYHGPTVLDVIEQFHTEPPAVDRPFRMPVQDVYKFTTWGDDRRIIAGTIESGRLRVGDEVVFLPSGKKGRCKTLEAFGRPTQTTAQAGAAVGFTLDEQVYVARGELATLAGQPRPKVTTRLRVSLFWLGSQPLVPNKEYLLKLGTARAAVRVEQIHRVVNASDLAFREDRADVLRNEVAECTLSLTRAIAFDLLDEFAGTSRFVLVDQHEIRGGGIVRQALPDGQNEVRERVLLRNHKWERSNVSPEQRAERYGQRPVLLLLTGQKGSDARKGLAKGLEARLFADGRVVYYLGMGSLVYGLDADLSEGDAGQHDHDRREHLRRLAEVAHLLLDAGLILIATAAELSREDLDLIRVVVDPVGPARPSLIQTVWVGTGVSTDATCDLVLPESTGDGISRLKGLLQDRGILFRAF